ncbi:MAG: GcrA family cell cycle regulator [Bradyrhizobium sp.]
MSAFPPTWTTERIELLKLHFAAGLTCRQIANEIGVSRNAVIGKVSRLKLMREDNGLRRAPRDAAKARRRKVTAGLRRQILKAVPLDEPVSPEAPIHNGHCCSLFELSEQTCRWPISTPGCPDFRFCGNPPIEGLPYCPGHSRLAYRVAAR